MGSTDGGGANIDQLVSVAARSDAVFSGFSAATEGYFSELEAVDTGADCGGGEKLSLYDMFSSGLDCTLRLPLELFVSRDPCRSYPVDLRFFEEGF